MQNQATTLQDALDVRFFALLCGRDSLWSKCLHGLNPHNCGMYWNRFVPLHEYIYNPEDYRLVYMNFARL